MMSLLTSIAIREIKDSNGVIIQEDQNRIELLLA
jgi:hypothetical protein